MKKIFPEALDVPPSVANRAVRIVERYLRMHRVDRTRDLPEEAKVRLYRDLRFFFEGDNNPPQGGSDGGFSLRRFLSRLWEKIEDFLSAFEVDSSRGPVTVLAWASFGETTRLTFLPGNNSQSVCEEPS